MSANEPQTDKETADLLNNIRIYTGLKAIPGDDGDFILKPPALTKRFFAKLLSAFEAPTRYTFSVNRNAEVDIYIP